MNFEFVADERLKEILIRDYDALTFIEANQIIPGISFPQYNVLEVRIF